jgi:hypothetical protein
MSWVNARHWAALKRRTGLAGCWESLTAMPPSGSRAHMAHWPLADDLVLLNQTRAVTSILFAML